MNIAAEASATSTTARATAETPPATGPASITTARSKAPTEAARRTRLRRRGTQIPEWRLLQPGGTLSIPLYTARVGHCSESLYEQASREIGIDAEVDGDRLREALAQAGREIEILAGRRFGVSDRKSVTILPQPFPFMEIPDLQMGSPMESEGAAIWPIPDPVNPHIATVVQLGEIQPPATDRRVPIGDALWAAGNLAARERRAGRLSADYVLWWLGNAIPKDQRTELLRAVVDQEARFSIPVLGVGIPGWWIQITRRLFWVTAETPDEGRLLEPLFDPKTKGEEPPMILAAGEPMLILVRTAMHPVDWALTARIWTEDVKVADDRPWRMMADAIHGSGIPIMTVDEASTDEEVGCQLVLLAHWHGYISADEDGLVRALIQAYPGPVRRIRSKTDQPDMAAAATLLLRRLLRPGFDPAKGAAATRRYVNRLASIVVLEHRKETAPAGTLPWQRLGITERHYYKLLRRARIPKIAGRYQVNDEVLNAFRAYLDWKEQPTPRQLAKQLLIERGFSESAARKWLQRHSPQQAVNARPRGHRAA